ncbi:ABC-2 transporter permease [Paenibacillus senegalensis]|uniref:ABC-2 transporter permease n=1 Tax=Paenibacillus senegalensis TaxID=1465766 RepID=UPI00028868FE|nr:ABC-2 transporter permease [Paenibacillus senegalensis]
MFNLIIRDIILQKKQLMIFIPYILFFILMGSPPILTFLVACIFIPFNAYAYDEKAETNILLNSLPYTRTEIIASRYLGAILYMAVSIGITSLALLVFNKMFTWTDIAIAVGLFLLFASLTFPLFQILKPGYISTVVLMGFILTSLGFLRMSRHLPEYAAAISEFMDTFSDPVLYTGAAVVVMAVYAVSWGVTTIIYQRKAF